MKFFYKQGEWIIDKRTQNLESQSNNSRQIDKIKSSLSCSVAEAFVIVGIFFKNPAEITIEWNNSLKEGKLQQAIQEKVNEGCDDLYTLFFDDDSPIVFRGTKISLFESEEEMKFNYELISKKLEKLGSNANVKFYKFKPEM